MSYVQFCTVCVRAVVPSDCLRYRYDALRCCHLLVRKRGFDSMAIGVVLLNFSTAGRKNEGNYGAFSTRNYVYHMSLSEDS